MGLFSFSYNKPGPGVSPDTPRKRGVARLLEVLGRDMGPFFKAGFLAVLGALPYIVGVALSVMTHSLLVLMVAAILGGMIAAPQIVGMAAVGRVYMEAMIIAYGEGSNGKSTFWNTIARVLGTYSGNMSADTLTVGCKRNVKPELAEAKGKRMIIAAELEEGMRLNTSNVKQLCSTDEIYAEKKYKAPFSYVPTHTLVLYTNHLPRVGAIDQGTWRRLIVIPFNAKIEITGLLREYFSQCSIHQYCSEGDSSCDKRNDRRHDFASFFLWRKMTV